VTRIVLVHGAWHGSWCWARVAEGLEVLGHRVTAVDLHRGPLPADPRGGRDAIDSADGDTVVCGHSYGGSVITGLAPARIKHAVYLAAPVPDTARAPAPRTASAVPLADWVGYRDDGASCVILPERAGDVFYHDCPAEIAAAATRRLVPQRTAVFAGSPPTALWKHVPATYIVCAEDRVFPARAQRQVAAARGLTAETLPTSHSPFLSRPDLLVRILDRIACS
jgi:pimeloyl-ACP methyl ester carboxylesterase